MTGSWKRIATEDIPEEWDLQAIVDYAHATLLEEGTLTKETALGQGERGNC